MIVKNIIGYLAEKAFFIKRFIVFIEESVILFLYKCFYLHSVIFFENSHIKKFKTTKQNIWFLCKMNLSKFNLRNSVFLLWMCCYKHLHKEANPVLILLLRKQFMAQNGILII